MILHAHGIRIELPRTWSGRVFRAADGLATLHAADFQLPLDDGEFGDRSTGAMPGVATVLALTEYEPGDGLVPGAGLFAPKRIRLPLDPTDFGSSRLQHPRPGQAVPFTVTVHVTPTGQLSATYVNPSRINLTPCIGVLGHDAARYTG